MLLCIWIETRKAAAPAAFAPSQDRKDRRTPHRYIDTAAYYASSVKSRTNISAGDGADRVCLMRCVRSSLCTACPSRSHVTLGRGRPDARHLNSTWSSSPTHTTPLSLPPLLALSSTRGLRPAHNTRQQYPELPNNTSVSDDVMRPVVSVRLFPLYLLNQPTFDIVFLRAYGP